MTIAAGVAKQLKYKVEGTWGTVPAAASAQLLRRVSSDLDLKKATYESNEIASHLQRQDLRHGLRRIDGSINGELSPGTYKDFLAASVRRAWTAVTAIAGASITIAGAGPTYTVTRAAGSFLTDGIKAGQVVRLSVGTFNAANSAKNLLVLSLSATVLTVMPLNGVALVAEGPIAGSTVTVTGKVTFAPVSAHTDLSYSIEHWYSDLSASEVFSGCKVDQVGIALPASGLATISLKFLGKDSTDASAEYFTSPTAETTSGILAASNGLLVAQGSRIAYVTGLSIEINNGMSGEPVAGSNTFADITEGSIIVRGNMTVLFASTTERDYFRNETEVALIVALTASPAAAASFMTLVMPRIKFTDAARDDGKKSLVSRMPFEALYNSAGGSGVSSEQTTIYLQDSDA